MVDAWRMKWVEGGEHRDSVMKSNNSLRLMGVCCCTRSKRNSIGFSGVQAHIPGIVLLTLRCETPKLMWVMHAGSGPGFSVISWSYLLLFDSTSLNCEIKKKEGTINGLTGN